MDTQKLMEVIDLYDSDLQQRYGSQRDTAAYAGSIRTQREHLRWMLGTMRGFVREGRIDKAMRWLGFVQGVLWSTNWYSLDELKSHNMPAGEQLDRSRV